MSKTWSQKYHTRTNTEIKVLEKRFADIQKGEKMVITTPKIVEDYIRSIPRGSERTIQDFRHWATKKYNADATCSVTSAIFLRIVAEKHIEDMNQGVAESEITPFWRMIGPKSPILKKLSFDLGIWKKHGEAENLPVT